MKVQHTHCAGLDVHKRLIVACVLTAQDKQIKDFGTTTPDLMELRAWLAHFDVTHVAMESTGSYWKPVYNLLEGGFELLVVNAAHIKAFGKDKTDVKDAEWIADLLRHGLLRASFIPSQPQRDLRELTRHRTNLVAKRAQIANELQKALESSNLKLQSVVTDITGVSARAMLRELLEQDNPDPAQLAELAKRRLRAKIPELRKALTGHLRPHHKIILQQLVEGLDFLQRQIDDLDRAIDERVSGQQPDIDRLDSIPGINQRVGEIIVAEMGCDMSRFGSAEHLASWVGLCPGNLESGGKRRHGRIRHGNLALKTALVEAAQGAARTKGSFFAGYYHRLAARRGKKKALIAVAHKLIKLIYRLLATGETYVEHGANYFDRLNPQRVVNRLAKRIQNLGFRVSCEPVTI